MTCYNTNENESLPTILASPLGLIGHSGLLFQTVAPRLYVYYADVGDLNGVLPCSEKRVPVEPSTFPAGIGVAADEPTAQLAALAEAIERYSAYAWSDEQFIQAIPAHLKGEALALHKLPRCSDRERTHPLCSWQSPDPDTPIRWVQGISLITGRLTWLPAILVYLGMAPGPGEHFIVPNSTGCACHHDLTRAITAGLCEVIERDAVALVWLQQLRLPRIEFDDVPDWLQPYLVQDPDSCFERHFFDASTDLGVPTVYAIETSRTNRGVSTLVACATALDPSQAVAKTICDLLSHRPAVELGRPLPSDPWTFTKSFQGCAFMATPEYRSEFGFLLDSPQRRRLSEIPCAGDLSDERAQLTWLLHRLESRGMEAYAVDLTPDEALVAGMSVVRAIVPDLMPVSFRLPMRYLAHPRLFNGPRAMGHPVSAEGEVNHWPQPFG